MLYNIPSSFAVCLSTILDRHQLVSERETIYTLCISIPETIFCHRAIPLCSIMALNPTPGQRENLLAPSENLPLTVLSDW